MSETWIIKHGIPIKEDFIEANVFTIINDTKSYSALVTQSNTKNAIKGILILIAWLGAIASLYGIWLALQHINEPVAALVTGITIAMTWILIVGGLVKSQWLESVLGLSTQSYASTNILALKQYTTDFLENRYKDAVVVVHEFSLSTDSLNKGDIHLFAHYSVDGQDMRIEINLVVDKLVQTLRVARFEITDDESDYTPASHEPSSITNLDKDA